MSARSKMFGFVVSAFVISSVVLALPAFAGPFCHGMTKWTFKSGQTPYSYNCNWDGTYSYNQAHTYALAQCQTVWDNFAQNYSDVNSFQVVVSSYTDFNNPNLIHWSYSCFTCVDGFLPAFPVKKLAVSVGQAGDIGGGLVNGQADSVRLHQNSGTGDSYYLVSVMTADGAVEVRVDANTGDAAVFVEGPSPICRQ